MFKDFEYTAKFFFGKFFSVEQYLKMPISPQSSKSWEFSFISPQSNRQTMGFCYCVFFIIDEIKLLNMFIDHLYFFPSENDQIIFSAYLSIGVFAFVLLKI